jgi:hypothetical protein
MFWISRASDKTIMNLAPPLDVPPASAASRMFKASSTCDTGGWMRMGGEHGRRKHQRETFNRKVPPGLSRECQIFNTRSRISSSKDPAPTQSDIARIDPLSYPNNGTTIAFGCADAGRGAPAVPHWRASLVRGDSLTRFETTPKSLPGAMGCRAQGCLRSTD